MIRMSLLLAGMLSTSVAQAAEISTRDGGHVQNPVWSPDGSWLAYEINNLSNSVELWLVKMDGGMGSQARQLRIPGASRSFGSGGTVVAAPVWTAKPSTMLFFEGSNAGGHLRVYYAMPGSASPNELIPTSTVKGNLSAPNISPNGKRFAFTTDATGSGDILVWELSGSSPPAIAASTPASENFPALDASGDRLAFSRKGNGEDIFFWTVNGQSGSLSTAAGDQSRPRWVGDQVVYFSSQRGEGHWDVMAVDGFGGRARTIARDVRLPVRAAPAVTPDGRHVVVVSSDPAEGDKIRMVALDGSGSFEIATGLVACGEPSVVEGAGRTWLAFTALPSAGADWRGLHVMDITGR
jgi:dipeptidyl aminopeptidase/acylaminoacyl peptidase